MNDLQVWPRSNEIEYDPYDIGPGDFLEYFSRLSDSKVIYEVVEVLDSYRGNPINTGYFSCYLKEICRPEKYSENPSQYVFAFGDYYKELEERFVLRLRHKDRILKTNMCKVLAARVFANEELNLLLLELEI